MAQEKKAIARPYAEAVLALAKETNSLDNWSTMLNLLSAVVQTQEVIELVTNPKFSRNQIEMALLEIVHDHFNEEGRNLLRILFKNNRLFLVPEIAAIYEQRHNESQGVLQAQVFSAYPLNDDQMTALIAALKSRFQRDIEIHSAPDPSLIGGALIRISGMVIDGSVRGQLQRLTNQLRI